MELKDLVVTPIWIIIILIAAYLIRPYVTDDRIRRYFFPALIFRLLAAILMGFLYQFYYDSGDTFLYHTRGSTIVYETIIEDPIEGVKLLFSDGNVNDHEYKHISRIRYFGDDSSYMIVRIATIFDLFTFGTYSATALFFALLSFSGCWAMYLAFDKYFPNLHLQAGIALLFIPTVIFWGSGLLKDSITLMAIGWFIYSFDQLLFRRRNIVLNVLILLFVSYILLAVKLYILLALLPSLIVWYFVANLGLIRNIVLRWLIAPFTILLCMGMAFAAINQISQSNDKYSLENISTTAMITANDIAYWTGKDAGSTYVLGDLDGSYQSLIRLFPSAINVTFFRPYPWEVNNVLMLLSSFESTILLFFFLYILLRSKIINLFRIKWPPIIIFAFVFAITFAFAVGVSTFNFGTLSRYKIPCMPLFLMVLIYVNNQLSIQSKRHRDLEYLS